MIEFTLSNVRTMRYGYAAQHLAECARLAGKIENFGAFIPHDTYVAGLKEKHGRKSGFLVDG